jgi:hypothetical protein
MLLGEGNRYFVDVKLPLAGRFFVSSLITPSNESHLHGERGRNAVSSALDLLMEIINFSALYGMKQGEHGEQLFFNCISSEQSTFSPVYILHFHDPNTQSKINNCFLMSSSSPSLCAYLDPE